MKTILTALLVAGGAALASAQVKFVGGLFQCAIDDGTYCAEDSMTSNIIIRCTNGMGQPGNCDDNLADNPPAGDSGSLCYQTSDTAGDAACSKNGTVYPDSGASYPVPSSSSGGAVSSTSVSYESTAVVTYTMATNTFTATTDFLPSTSGSAGTSITSGGSSSSGTTTTFFTPPPTASASASGEASVGGASHMDVEALGAFAGFGVLVVAAALL